MRVAIVGGGNICQTAHIPALLRLGTPIVSVTDPNEAVLSAVRSLLQQAVNLLKSSSCDVDEQADCAIVCSPPALHAAQVDHLLRKGVHVLCEKPLACTFADAEGLKDLASRSGLILQVGYFRRFHPAAQAVRDVLRNSELGNPLRCIFNAGHCFSSPPASLMSRTQSGGGVLMDIGVHLFDRLLSWFDAVNIDEYADDACGGIEANGLVKARGCLPGRCVPIEIRLSRTAELGYSSRLDFEYASIECPLNVGHNLALKAGNHSGGTNTLRRLVGDLAMGSNCDHIYYFCQQFREFCGRIRGESESVSNLSDAVRVNALVEDCYRRRTPLRFDSGW